MGCIFRLTAIVALATGIHVNLASETFAYPSSGLPQVFSGTTELLDQNLSNSAQEEGIPGDAERGGGGRSLKNSNANREEEGLPETKEGAGSR